MIALRGLGAAFAGYVVIALGTTLVLELWLGGVTYAGSSAAVLARAAVGSFAAGIAGGFVAAWIGGRRPLLHAAGVSVFLALDSASILLSDRFTDPWWFTVMAGVSLMVATLVGGLLRDRLQQLTAAPIESL